MDDEGKLPQRDCSGDALRYAALPDMLVLTAPHSRFSPSDAPRYQGVHQPKRHSPGHQCLMAVVFGSPYI